MFWFPLYFNLMSRFKYTVLPPSVVEQDSSHGFYDMNVAYKAQGHDNLFQMVSESNKLGRETLFHKVSDHISKFSQGITDLINVPSKIADSIQEIW